MAQKLGENIQREWNAERFPDELWDGLQTLKHNRKLGIEELADLAERGSALVMMFLGHALSKGIDQAEIAEGETWLRRSAEGGSIEGRFQLAVHYDRQNAGELAVLELKALSDQGYAPAMYLLGSIYYRGETVDRNLPDALRYFKLARAAGHIVAAARLSQIYLKEDFGIAGRLASHWYCLVKMPAATWYIFRYPNSDRLRGLIWPTAKNVSSTTA